METLCHISELRSALNQARSLGQRIAFVPTMGNLHAGHLALVQEAKKHCKMVVVSIFVNPLQFAANEDLDSYPRTLSADQAALKLEGATVLFAPTATEMYPKGQTDHCLVSCTGLTDTLCGASRPGHFDGVATVVSKLFNIVAPDIAVFGEKDFQQLAVIRKMTEDLCMNMDIIGVATARASDGLALSSRNGYLSEEQRKLAPQLYQQLCKIQGKIAQGENNFADLEQQSIDLLNQSGFVVDYFAIRDSTTLAQVSTNSSTATLLVAASLGNTRLIDNVTFALNQGNI